MYIQFSSCVCGVGFCYGYKKNEKLGFHHNVRKYFMSWCKQSSSGTSLYSWLPNFWMNRSFWSYRETFEHWKDSSHGSFLVLFQNVPKDTPLRSNVNSICFRWKNLFHTSNFYIWEIIITEPFHRFLKSQKVNLEEQIRVENV